MSNKPRRSLTRIILKPLVSVAAAALLFQLMSDSVPAQSPTPSPSTSAARPPVRNAPRPAPVAAVQVRSELAIDRWLRPGEFAWNDEGVAAGETVVVVNIRARVLSVYRGGIEIGRSSIIYGTDSQPTPHGTFRILERDADHRSSTYGGAPMPHSLRLTWDGVALHGTDHMQDDWATRGCVGLPREFAERLFGVARLGDRVVIWSGTASA